MQAIAADATRSVAAFNMLEGAATGKPPDTKSLGGGVDLLWPVLLSRGGCPHGELAKGVEIS